MRLKYSGTRESFSECSQSQNIRTEGIFRERRIFRALTAYFKRIESLIFRDFGNYVEVGDFKFKLKNKSSGLNRQTHLKAEDVKKEVRKIHDVQNRKKY